MSHLHSSLKLRVSVTCMAASLCFPSVAQVQAQYHGVLPSTVSQQAMIRAADGSEVTVHLVPSGLAVAAAGRNTKGKAYSISVPEQKGAAPIVIAGDDLPETTISATKTLAGGQLISYLSSDGALTIELERAWKVNGPGGGTGGGPVVVTVRFNGKQISKGAYSRLSDVAAAISQPVVQRLPKLAAGLNYFKPFFIGYLGEENALNHRVQIDTKWWTAITGGAAAAACALASAAVGAATAGVGAVILLADCAVLTTETFILSDIEDTGHSGPENGQPPAPTGNPGEGDTKPVVKEGADDKHK